MSIPATRGTVGYLRQKLMCSTAILRRRLSGIQSKHGDFAADPRETALARAVSLYSCPLAVTQFNDETLARL